MAISTLNSPATSVGAAWNAFLQAWRNNAVLSSPGTVSSGISTSLGFRSIFLQIENPVGTGTKTHYVCADLVASIVNVPIQYVLQSSGWRGTIPLSAGSQTAATIKTAFEAIILPARKALLETWCGTPTVTYASQDYSSLLPGIQQTQYLARLSQNWLMAVDVVPLIVQASNPGFAIPGQLTFGDGAIELGGSTNIVGGVVNGDEVVASLNDIATVDFDYSANNGGDIFSLRGRTRSP